MELSFKYFPSPWLLYGDFNAILNREEHRGGFFSNYASKFSLVLNFISKNNLLDLGFIISCLSWCNNQEGLAKRWARLDQFLANINWVSSYNSYTNHSPLFSVQKIPNVLSKTFFCLKIFGTSMNGVTKVSSALAIFILKPTLCTIILIRFLALRIIFSSGNTWVFHIQMKNSIILIRKSCLLKMLYAFRTLTGISLGCELSTIAMEFS